MPHRSLRVRVLAALLMLLARAPALAAEPLPRPTLQDETTADERAVEACETIKVGIKEYKPTSLETALRQLDELYGEVSAKTRKKVDKSLASVFKLKPRKPDLEGEDTRVEIVEVYLLAVGILYDEESGPELLQGALKNAHVKGWADVEGAILEGLGYRKDAKLVALLAGYLESAGPLVAGSAAKALGEYSEQPQSLRREIALEILTAWESFATEADKETRRKREGTEARDALTDVEGPFGNALVRLTRQDLADVAAWRAWYDEHGADGDW